MHLPHRLFVYVLQSSSWPLLYLCVVTDTEESEYQTDYDEDAVLSDFDQSYPNSENSEHTEDEEEETADTLDTVRQLER